MGILEDIAARDDAREMGLRDYEAGRPCTKCHEVGWRRVSDDRCLMCDPATLKRRARELAALQREAGKEARRYARGRGDDTYESPVTCEGCDAPGWRWVFGDTCVRCNPSPPR